MVNGTKRKVTEVVDDSVKFLDRPKTNNDPAMATVGVPEDTAAFPDDLPF